MFRSIFVLTVLASVFGLTALNSNAAVKDYAVAEAYHDTDLPVESGSYDPCCPWLKWKYTFNRINAAEGNAITFEVDGASGTDRTYRDTNYPVGQTYRFSEVTYIGSSTYNNIKISLTEGDGGTFWILIGEAWYSNDNPE